MSASASLSVDVAVVAETVAIAREDIDVVTLVERARRVHHLESSLLNCMPPLPKVYKRQMLTYYSRGGYGRGAGRGGPPPAS